MIKRSIFTITLLLFLIAVVSMAQARENGSAVDLDLDALRWKNRVLVLCGPDESDHSFRLQKEDLASNSEGVLERDLVILEILEHGKSRIGKQLLSEKSVQDTRKTLGVQTGPFQVLLIGKDGGVKLRSAEPVPTKDIFGLIDSMPMRRQEMEHRKKPRP